MRHAAAHFDPFPTNRYPFPIDLFRVLATLHGMPANEHYPEPSGQALPRGTRIEEFVIERVLGSGGFGITYLARDTALGRQVVIKENLPAQFCFRHPNTLTVAPRHSVGEDVENFHWSLENFSKEAAMLASLDHPGIVRVHRSFQALGTAYFVMPFVEGVAFDSLIELNKAKDRSFDETGLHGLLVRMLDALSYLHDRGIYHRDIKPGNILITNAGVPVLIDFGSARQRLSERSMTVVESPGYTPFEQLQSRGNVGPWSDLYALGGTLVKAITGEAPPKANDRVFDDPFEPMTNRANLVSVFSSAFLDSLDRALKMRPAERWQDAGEWLAGLQGQAAISVHPPGPAKPQILQTTRTLGTQQIDPSIPSTRTNNAPRFVNSLGMEFEPVKITRGPSAGQQVLFSIWMTRVQDYRKYAEAQGVVDLAARSGSSGGGFQSLMNLLGFTGGVNGEWKKPGFAQGEDHPVVCVSWEDAVAFCEWLTQQERSAGTITTHQKYRLPTDHEWSCAVGIGEREDAVASPKSKNDKLGEVYPWGTQWPPPKGAGNYESSLKVDDFEKTSPVGKFPVNASGLYDLGGNAWEWCEDLYSTTSSARVLRGGSWDCSGRVFLRSACRLNDDPRDRFGNGGFRVVLVGGAG